MMKSESYNRAVNLLAPEEQELRIGRLKNLMGEAGISHAIVRDNSGIYYLTGRVFRGFIFIAAEMEHPLYFVHRPNILRAPGHGELHLIRKPEDMGPLLEAAGIDTSVPVALELDALSYAEARRVAAVFGSTPELNLSPVLRAARAVKTAVEQDMLRMSGRRQSLVYERLPHYYREGMTDIEFQIEIERALRLEGCLGQFRIAGSDMELFMANVLTGENADTPTAFDFAMGGAGADPSVPVGANGTIIRPGYPVMVDANGNFNGYMTDMTRMYAPGEPVAEAERINKLSADICSELAAMMAPGVPAKALYEKALAMATEAGLADNFMGHRYHAGFVGHGIGIEVNELPVLAPRSRDILAEGNVIAVEPKFVIPGLGAVGIENTYIVRATAPAELITTASTAITRLT
ncbi:MAG: Xaa-Pro peptidase family protein [Muribaculaceae bacterium]|nr:Xaa-Pro peptidase family protein [Muribaculaceae bacterium]